LRCQRRFLPMALSNFERMIQLADEVFAVKSDPNQLDVNEEVLDHLRKIHPATVSEYDDGHGPVAWVLVIPTTLILMHRFLKGEISEKELYEQTPLNIIYDTIYLCSAMVLEEYRRKGIARRLTTAAIEMIRKDHPIQFLFVWSFSKEGKQSAESIARAVSLPLFHRED
jgi:ribosomal protein S18 acetylase RimI-like enzyme